MARACDVTPIKGKTPPKGRDITYEETVLLLRACAEDSDAQGVRDAALFAVGYHRAPRIAEVANLDLEDYKPETGALMIRRGKGNKTRQVFVTGGAANALNDWIEVRGDEAGALFLPIRKDGLIQHVRKNGKGPDPARLSTWAISKRLERRRDQAGLEPLTWHDWRRTLAGDLIDSGDLAGGQLTLGHSSPAVTMRYSRRDLKIVQDVLSKRQTPYVKRTKVLEEVEN
jgi:integrase